MKQLISSLLIIALLSVINADAQSQSDRFNPSIQLQSQLLPIWDQKNQQIEGYVYLDPPSVKQIGKRWQLRSHSLDAVLGLSARDSLGFLCNQSIDTANNSLHHLADRCFLARFGKEGADHKITATAELNGHKTRYGVSAAAKQDSLATFYPSNSRMLSYSSAHVNQNDLTIFGLHNLGQEGFISIDGTYARARLISVNDLTPAIAGQWNRKSLSVRGGVGAFSASIIGHVIVAQGRSDKWKGLDLGLSWLTPWSGHLSVGAENIISRGKNPFSAEDEMSDTSTTPYVRYEQDL